jgi:peptidoglycan/LPS O-acetylase OafA/YrhL
MKASEAAVTHLAGLTEIRAIAALTVMVFHIDQFSILLKIPAFGLFETGMAGFAVTIFFVLSGFLITHLMLKEKELTGSINTYKFYMRRVLRIWPAYYLTILCGLTLLLFGLSEVPTLKNLLAGILGFIFMVPNVIYVLNLTFIGTSPLWSIGVEEQFYLAWPFVVGRVRHPIFFLTVLIMCYGAIKILVYLGHPSGGLYQLIRLSQFDAMSLGALGAYWNRDRLYLLKQVFFHPIAQLSAMLILVAPLFLNVRVFANFEMELYALAAFVWILNAALNPKSFINIHWKGLQGIGRISYGIYAYHFICIYLIALIPFQQHWGIVYIEIMALALLLAYLSYRFIEKPILERKQKYTVVESRN